MTNTNQVRLSDLIAEDKLLWVYCCDCGHKRDVNPATVPLPAETPVPDVGKQMRCSACGSRKINTKPELYPGGVEAMQKGKDVVKARRLIEGANLDPETLSVVFRAFDAAWA